ncbi:MAG: hypothetical protein HY782_10435 [Chloroflexi bacterium]|nr:hypothetical protein [Chloroflexota bacterium]
MATEDKAAKASQEPDAIQRAIEYGVDVTLLRENLKRTPAERMENAQDWVLFAEELGAASKSPNHAASRQRHLLDVLDSHSVKYVIVGDVATIAHGARCADMVLQLCFAREVSILEKLARALAPLQPRLRGVDENLPFVLDERTLRNGLNFTLVTDAGNLDLLGEVAGIGDYRKVLANSEAILIYEREQHVLTLEALIRAKKAAGRQKDLQALPELEALLELKNRGDA